VGRRTVDDLESSNLDYSIVNRVILCL
jgi:hypothetical protein